MSITVVSKNSTPPGITASTVKTRSSPIVAVGAETVFVIDAVPRRTRSEAAAI